MLDANLLSMRATRLKTSKREREREQERAVSIAWKALTQSAEFSACTPGLLMSVWNSVKIHSWHKKGFWNFFFFQHKACGRKWMVLIRHWNLFVYDRWCLKMAGGRWHLGGRPRCLHLLHLLLKHDGSQRKSGRQQVTDKRGAHWLSEIKTNLEAHYSSLATSMQWFVSFCKFLCLCLCDFRVHFFQNHELDHCHS